MEKLDVLKTTTKQQRTKKYEKDRTEDNAEKSKNKTKKFHKKNLRSKAKK